MGTSALTVDRPVRNYQQSTFEQRESISGQRMAQDYFLKPKSCLFCPFPCDHIYVVGKGPFRGTWGAGFQSGQLWWYGDNIGVSDPDIIVRASALSNEYGVDLMGMSGVIAFGMECFQRGVLTLADTGNLRLEWGNGEVGLKLIEMTVYRQGLGALFAEGIKKVSQQIGKGSEEYALHVKGLYPDEHDPRTRKGTGLAYAVAGRGAEHCGTLKRSEAPGPFGFDPIRGEVLGGQPLDPLTEDGKAQVVKWYEDVRAFENCMEICSFASRFYPNEVGLPGTLAKLYNAVTGFDLTEKDVMHIGERVINLGRAFNVREGLTRKDDTLPDRFLKEKMPDGPAKGHVVKLQPMLDEYYSLRGWSNSGLPTKAKLVELGLEHATAELESMGKLG